MKVTQRRQEILNSYPSPELPSNKTGGTHNEHERTEHHRPGPDECLGHNCRAGGGRPRPWPISSRPQWWNGDRKNSDFQPENAGKLQAEYLLEANENAPITAKMIPT